MMGCRADEVWGSQRSEQKTYIIVQISSMTTWYALGDTPEEALTNALRDEGLHLGHYLVTEQGFREGVQIRAKAAERFTLERTT